MGTTLNRKGRRACGNPPVERAGGLRPRAAGERYHPRPRAASTRCVWTASGEVYAWGRGGRAAAAARRRLCPSFLLPPRRRRAVGDSVAAMACDRLDPMASGALIPRPPRTPSTRHRGDGAPHCWIVTSTSTPSTRRLLDDTLADSTRFGRRRWYHGRAAAWLAAHAAHSVVAMEDGTFRTFGNGVTGGWVPRPVPHGASAPHGSTRLSRWRCPAEPKRRVRSHAAAPAETTRARRPGAPHRGPPFHEQGCTTATRSSGGGRTPTRCFTLAPFLEKGIRRGRPTASTAAAPGVESKRRRQ